MSFQDLESGGAKTSATRPTQKSSQSVAAGIFQINTSVAGFRRLVDAIGTSKDTPDHRQKLHNTRQRIVQLVKETSSKLKSLTDSDRSTQADPSKRIEDAKLTREFQTSLQEFQKVQQLASERESAYSPAQPSPSSRPATYGSDDQSEPSMEEESQPFVMQQKRQELLLLGNEISFNEAIIEERDQGIMDIQNEIGQANEIFKDLAVLVHDQGVVIDDIHSNIDTSASATTQGRVQLSRANKSGKSKSSWCWWLLALSVLVLVIILLVIIL